MDADDRPSDLLRKYGAATQPTPARRERTWAAVAARTSAPTASWWTTNSAKIGLAVTTLAIVSGAALWSGSHEEVATTTVAPAIVEAPPTTIESAPTLVPEPAVAPPAPAAATIAPRPRRSAPVVATSAPIAPAPSSLAAEIALLGAAQRSLAHGDAQHALDTLDQHAATYPSSTLAADRDTARVTALCELGRDAEARALAATLGTRSAITRALTHCRETP